MIQVTDHDANQDGGVEYLIDVQQGSEVEFYDMLIDVTNGYNIQIERLSP
jgi:hypothetical protein